jgi:hypothetical protein
MTSMSGVRPSLSRRGSVENDALWGSGWKTPGLLRLDGRTHHKTEMKSSYKDTSALFERQKFSGYGVARGKSTTATIIRRC